MAVAESKIREYYSLHYWTVCLSNPPSTSFYGENSQKSSDVTFKTFGIWHDMQIGRIWLTLKEDNLKSLHQTVQL